MVLALPKVLRPYSKSKLELNSSDAKIFSSVFEICHKERYKYSSLSFIKLSWGRITDKLAINWKNSAQVGLQLKFAFWIWQLVLSKIQLNTVVDIQESGPQLRGRNFIVITASKYKSQVTIRKKTNGKLNKSILYDTVH